MEKNKSVVSKGTDEENWGAVAEYISQEELIQLGTYFSHMIHSDIKHVMFTLSRYKFASKLLMYRENVNLLELGCQEALGAIMFKQNISLNQYVGVDLDEKAIAWNQKWLPNNFKFVCSNFFDCDEIIILFV